MTQEDERLQRIFQESCKLFIVPGYASTKMKDIAAAAKVAVGSLYSLFESKEALLDFVFLSALNQQAITQIAKLPMKAVSSVKLVADTKVAYQQQNARLYANLQNDDYLFETLISDLFTIFQSDGQYFLILERNPTVNPELLSLYKKARQNLYKKVGEYLKRQQQHSTIRSSAHPNYDAMLIIDTIFWWSAHKRFDAFESSQNTYSLPEMQKTVTNQLLAGYLK